MTKEHDNPERDVSIESAASTEKLTIKSPMDHAAGIHAVTVAMQHQAREPGLVRGLKVLSKINQKEGFDCPSCAWPDPDQDRSIFEYCENGAKAVASETTRKRITPEFFAKHSVKELSEQSDHWLERQGRLTCPMLLDENQTHYQPISWEDAYSLVGRELKSLDHPNQAMFYTSGRASNEASFVYQLLARAFGTNNLPDCSNMCHESSGVALTETIGIGKGTVRLEDFEEAGAIFVIGQNPATNHPRMLSALQKAVRKGTKIVAVNPLPEAGLMGFRHPQQLKGMLGITTQLASLYLPVRLGGDQALFQGIAKLLLERDAGGHSRLDHAFISSHTTGFESLKDQLRQIQWSTLEELSGLRREQIEEAADVITKSKATIYCWAMGLTQHVHSVSTLQQVVNVALLCGDIGRPGAGLCPVRGHSNVQGNRTMGIGHDMPEPFLDALDKTCHISAPRERGLDVVESIMAMQDGRAHVFIALGGNFLSASPDTSFTAEAIQRCRLTVQVSTKLNRSHLVTGKRALILPCRGRTELDQQATGPQYITVEDSMSKVHRSHGQLEPASPDIRSEVSIICHMAAATLGTNQPVPWLDLAGDYNLIRDMIGSVVPDCGDYTHRTSTSEGFYLPVSPRDRWFVEPDGRARFMCAEPFAPHAKENELLLATLRSHDQFNTTIYGLHDRYRGIHGDRRVIFMNKTDMDARGLKARQRVNISCHAEGRLRRVTNFTVVPYEIPVGCVGAYYPETNMLVPLEHTAKGSNTPISKSVPVTVEPTA